MTYPDASWGWGRDGGVEVSTGADTGFLPGALGFWQEHRQDLSHGEETAVLTAQFLR